MDHCRDSDHVLSIDVGQRPQDSVIIWIRPIPVSLQFAAYRGKKLVPREIEQNAPGALAFNPQTFCNVFDRPGLGPVLPQEQKRLEMRDAIDALPDKTVDFCPVRALFARRHAVKGGPTPPLSLPAEAYKL